MPARAKEQSHITPDVDLRAILTMLNALKRGEFSTRVPEGLTGLPGKVADALNDLAEMNEVFASEITAMTDAIRRGRFCKRIPPERHRGGWAAGSGGVNEIADELAGHANRIVAVVESVAKGDLRQKIELTDGDNLLKGDFLRHAKIVNSMVDKLDEFGSEVTRVAREVGVDGKLGAQAQVRGVSGTWKDLTDNVNLMAINLTNQVRDIAQVTTAVAQGDLTKKITVEVRGEINDLKSTINTMVDQLRSFADEVTRVAREVGTDGVLGGQAEVRGVSGTWRELTENVNQMADNLTNQMRAIGEVATAVTKGDYSQSVQVEARGEIALLKDNVNQMIATLSDSTAINEQQDWLKTNLAAFTRMLQGEKDLATVAQKVISELAGVIDAQHGAFYLSETIDEETHLKLVASYAYCQRNSITNQFKLGEGLVGQCALEKHWIDVRSVPDDYIQINSGLGRKAPNNILVHPIIYENEVKGVVELASFHEFTEIERSFLDQFFETLGTIISSIESGQRTEELLKQSQRLTEELQNQQEELQQTNEELEEKAREVSKQNEEVERKNAEVENARSELEEKAKQLSLTSKYKTEFLANMSHELRTPLNSLLILSQQLADNYDKNLNGKQIEQARTIFSSGRDLLSLINEVLDLAKVESGTMAIDVAEVNLPTLQERLEKSFDAVAREKNLDFQVTFDARLPTTIESDEKRLMQVLRNLLSNAFKFTETGGVHLTVDLADKGWRPSIAPLNSANQVVSLAVNDTGIGIQKERLNVIFEAFQQADGSTSRRFGGTGLGLSISREIANMLGGDLVVESELEVGSTFTLYLPANFDQTFPVMSSQLRKIEDVKIVPDARDMPKATIPVLSESTPKIEDDRDIINDTSRTLLVIEDDSAFARIVMERARQYDFKVLLAGTGQDGLALARKYKPDAVTLDLHLPDMHGWVILDRLKHDPQLRHIPVHVMSVDDDVARGLQFGAIDIVQKPLDQEALTTAVERISNFVDRKVHSLLVVEDDEVQRQAIIDLIGNGDVISKGVESGEEALRLLQKKQYDCMIVDLKLPGMSGFELIRRIRDDDNLDRVPIVIYTGRELSRHEETRLRKLTDSIIVKGANSPERLLDETALFLHRVEANLPDSKQKIIRELYLTDPALAGKKVLIVDDDARNIFATTSILERYDMKVVNAESGKEGIELLRSTPDIDLVLMDIMMPEMDGYQAIRAIRKLNAFTSLPIIALTAKAMPDDRSKCIEAGASDYIVKPVDAPQLISLMRVWLYK